MVVQQMNSQKVGAWVSLVEAFSRKDGDDASTVHKRLQHANLSALCDPASLIAVAKYILEHLCNQMKNECIPSFSLALLRCLDDPDDANNAESAFEAVNDMAGNLSAHLQAIDVVTSQLRPHVQSDAPASSLSKVVLLHHTYLSAVSAMLQTSVKADLQKVLAVFFSDRLHELRRCTEVDLQSLLEQVAANGDAQEPIAAGSLTNPAPVDTTKLPAKWLACVHGMADALGRLKLQSLSLEVLTAVVRQDVHDSIAGLGKEWFSVRVLGPVEQYVAAAPLLFLRLLLPRMVPPTELQEAEQQECLRLQFFVYDTIGRLLVDYMFDIMMDYPDSAPAVLDLSECMKRTNLHRHFVDSLSAAIRKRLLHPGVATENIVDAYINAIKVLQCIDKSGVVLNAVTEPVKTYLRARPDTIRCVVKMLTQEHERELQSGSAQDESEGPGGGLLADTRAPAGAGIDGDEIEGPDGVLAEAEAWTPTPIELDNARLHDPASFDIISTLVDIYGDSLFVAEYKRMLGTRLMKKADFNTDFETQTLELLKLRFLESELHHCDVMLKDTQQSRRHVHSLMHPDQASQVKLASLQPHLQRLSVLICSHLFWPKVPDANIQLELPDWVRQAADAHAKAFQLAKAPRKLSFEPALGAVEVELEIGGCVQTYSVSPVLATIILPFEQHESITAAQLVKMTSIPMDVILRKALFWVQQGALLEARLPGGNLQYRRAQKLPGGSSTGGAIICEDPEDDDIMPARRHQNEPENDCKQHLDLINNIVASNKQCTLERMHKLLLLMGRHRVPKYDKTEDDLLEFLDSLVEKGHLICEGSAYSLAKKE